MGLKPTSKVQYGKQVSLSGGTVATTAKLVGLYSGPWEENHQISQVASLNGDLAQFHGISADLHKVAEVKTDATLTFEDAPVYFGMGIKSGVTGSSDGGSAGPTYIYTYTPTLASSDQPDFYSLEVGDETQGHRINGAFARSLEISAAVRDRTHIKADIAGRYLDANVGFTAGSAGNDHNAEEVLGQNWTVTIDDTGTAGTIGTIGTTAYSGCIVNLNWKWMGFKEHDCLNGTTYYASVKTQPLAPQLQMTVEVDTVAYTTLRAAYVGQTQQLIRLENLGGTVHSGTPTATKRKAIQLDGCYRITAFGPIGGSDADGVQTVQITAVGEYNTTYAKVGQVTVRNALVAPY